MSLRCSVLGHDFGESEVEREQEREGSEVVVTVREFETCNRCGETKLISENTNVTAAEDATADADDGAADEDDRVSADEAFSSDRGTPSVPRDADAPADGVGAEASGSDGLTPPADGADDAEILGDEPPAEAEPATDTAGDAATESVGDEDLASLDDESAGDEDLEIPGESPAEADDPEGPDDLASPDGADDAVAPEEGGADILEAEATDDDHEAEEEAVTDDGVILDEAEEPTERGHGEWPDADAKHPAEAEGDTPDSAVGWPETEGDDEGYDATAGADAGTEDVDLGGGLASESADAVESADDPEEGHDAEFIDSPDRAPADVADEESVDSGITRSRPAQVPDGSTPVDRPTEFHCPRCDHVVPATRSSLRAGDICPECSMGYLAERER